MNVNEFYSYIEEINNKYTNDDDYSTDILDKYVSLITKYKDIYDNVDVFENMVSYSSYRFKPPSNTAYCLQAMVNIFRATYWLEKGRETTTELEEYIIHYMFDNIYKRDDFKTEVIEFLYSCASLEAVGVFRFIGLEYSNDIDINLPTKYGFPLFWEIMYDSISNSIRTGTKSNSAIYILNMLKNRFDNFDINNTGRKKHGVFTYLFELKSGTVIYSDKLFLEKYIEFIVTSKNYKPYPLEIEDAIYYMIDNGTEVCSYIIRLIIENVNLDYTYIHPSRSSSFFQSDNIVKRFNLLETLMKNHKYLNKDNKLIDILIDRIKNNILPNLLSRLYLDKIKFFSDETKEMFKKLYERINIIKSERMNNILNLLDSIDN